MDTVSTTAVDFPNRSASIAKLASALAKAQGAMVGAAKDSTNPHFKSKYADLASVWDACRKPLASNELSILQPVTADGSSVTVTTILAHSSGEWIAESLTMTAQQPTPQAVGSTITYGRRYGLSAMVGIAPEDDDAEAATARGFERPHESVASRRPETSGGVGSVGDRGPLVIAEVRPGRAGAVAEIVLKTGETFLTFKQPIKVKAEASLKNKEAVVLGIKKSSSGNFYVDSLLATGMTDDAIEGTRFRHDDDPTVTVEEPPF